MRVGNIYKSGANLMVSFSGADSMGAGKTGLTVKFSIYNPANSRYWGGAAFNSVPETLFTAAEIGDGLYRYTLTSGYALGEYLFQVHVEATESVTGDFYDVAEDWTLENHIVPIGIQKNVAISAYKFVMFSSSTGNPAAGASITATRKLDGDVSWQAMSGSVTDNGSGAYSIDINAADTNGDTGVWKFSASGFEDTLITFLTS